MIWSLFLDLTCGKLFDFFLSPFPFFPLHFRFIFAFVLNYFIFLYFLLLHFIVFYFVWINFILWVHIICISNSCRLPNLFLLPGFLSQPASFLFAIIRFFFRKNYLWSWLCRERICVFAWNILDFCSVFTFREALPRRLTFLCLDKQVGDFVNVDVKSAILHSMITIRRKSTNTTSIRNLLSVHPVSHHSIARRNWPVIVTGMSPARSVASSLSWYTRLSPRTESCQERTCNDSHG